MAEVSEQQVCAAVLAASGPADPVARAYGVPCKAMVPVMGVPVVRRVVNAVAAARRVRETTVIVSQHSPVADMVADMAKVAEAGGPQITDTLQAAIDTYSQEPHVLLVTCDLPLLTPVAVDDFVRQALADGAELTYSIVSKSIMESRIHGSKRLFVPLRDGRWTGGNLFLISPEFVRREQVRIAQAFAGRKNVVALARLLGLRFALQLLMGRCGVPEVVAQAQRLLNCRLSVVKSTHPEVAFDIDKRGHVEVASRVLAQLEAERSPRRQ